MVELAMKIPYESTDELQQNNGLVSSLFVKPGEVDLKTQVK